MCPEEAGLLPLGAHEDLYVRVRLSDVRCLGVLAICTMSLCCEFQSCYLWLSHSFRFKGCRVASLCPAQMAALVIHS